MKQFATDLFKAGTQDQALVKKSDKSMDFGWEEVKTEVPGARGEFLMSDGNGGIIRSYMNESNMAAMMNPRMTFLYKHDVGDTLVQIRKTAVSSQSSMAANFHIDEEDPTKLIVSFYTQYAREDSFTFYINISDQYHIESITPSGELTAEFEYANYLKVVFPFAEYEAGSTTTYVIKFDVPIQVINLNYRYDILEVLTVPDPARTFEPAGKVLMTDGHGGYAWGSLPTT